MANVQTDPVQLPGGSPTDPHGVLANASPAPAGWENGGLQVSRLCQAQRVSISCSGNSTRSAPDGPGRDEFFAFVIEQGSGCSTLSGGDREREALSALEEGTDYSLGAVLMTATVQPSLNDATFIGTVAGAAAALAKLEREAAANSLGAQIVIHATVSAATFLAEAGLIDSDRRTPAGNRIIVSSGYSSADETEQLWATGRVFASVGPTNATSAVSRDSNGKEAWATRDAIVAFNTCVNLTVKFTTTAANPAP